jgi:nuclear inhibitor of protein phosphatase 1
MATNYEPPSWAGKPGSGLHLDVLKDGKLIQKLMVDEKKCYLFGRNPQLNDFCIDHGSCSRIHSALVWHKHLERSFLVDLGSTHGTYIGNFRIEKDKPTQLPVDSTFRFGESSRKYIIRERPKTMHRPVMDELEKGSEVEGAGLLGLPETENELDNLTEYNTAQNRRISMMGIPKDDNIRKRRKIKITFNEEEDVINPEDIDPSVGRFRNMVTTTVIPKKKKGVDMGLGLELEETEDKAHHEPHIYKPVEEQGLYDDLEAGDYGRTLSSSLGLPLPNPAPEIDISAKDAGLQAGYQVGEKRARADEDVALLPKKKKYAKEAWPGRKPGPAQGLF